MPLFPSRRYAFMPAPPQEQTVRDKFTAPQRRRGLFGGPARGIVRREDGDPGTLLNYLVFGQGGVEGMRESRMNRDLFGMRSQAFKQEQADAQRQRGEIDAAIGTLDPSMQPWARLAPEAAARAALAQPDYEVDAAGRPYTIQNGRVMYGEGQVAVPPRGGAGGGTIQYRPVTPAEASQYGLPGNGAGFVMGTNGRPIRVGGGSFSPDQRARVEIGFEPALEAVNTMDEIEQGVTREEMARGISPRDRRESPRNSQWGASIVDMMDGEGTGALARNWGGQSFQEYTSAGSAFESGMLPILSGAAVTDSEARRMIRAAIPQLGDGAAVLAQKARRRHQMLNGAAVIGGRPPPYPEEGVPDWATRAGNANEAANAGDDTPPEGISAEEWAVATPEERAAFGR